MKITFVTVSAPVVQHLIAAEKKLLQGAPEAMELSIYYAVSAFTKTKLLKMADDLASSDFAFIDLMGASPEVICSVSEGLERCKGQIVPYGNGAREHLRLGELTAESMTRSSAGGAPVKMPDEKAMRKMRSMAETMGKLLPGKMRDMRNYSLLMKYFKVASFDNIYNMLLFILDRYGDEHRCGTAQEPCEVPPLRVLSRRKLPERPTIALLHYGHCYPTDTASCVEQLAQKLERVGNVLPIAVSGITKEVLSELRSILLREKPDAIVNLMSFRLSAGPMGGDTQAGTELLRELGVPYLHPFFISRRTVRDWQLSVQGCTTSEVMISLLLPELDGCIDTIPIGAMSEPVIDQAHDVYTEQLQLIQERADRLCTMVEKQIALRQKPNREKRVALICYNYPPGEDNLFGGAFLDTFASVAAITERLAREGYTLQAQTAEMLKSHFCAGKAVNSGKYFSGTDGMILYPVAKYKEFPDITAAWGRSPGEIMAQEQNFLIPGMVTGNVFIGLQPTRGAHEVDASAYHDRSAPPHHQYAAFYRWLKEEFQADAIVHVGTHGTLEFLKGKEAGMSGECYPDLLLGGIPHLYLYYCGNPAEATIAKRRSHAILVSYQPPVFVKSGLYGELAQLSEEIDNYRQALLLAPQAAADILQRIEALADEQKLPREPEALENELYRIRESLIPKGLHVFGTPYTDEEAEDYIDGLRGYACAQNADLQGIADAAKKTHEMQSLMDALSGRYIPARAAGDIYREPQVLPSGYNLYQFDPKLIPTATAYERGKRIAENTLQVYRDEKGSYPTSVAVVLWGMETSRTQGETFGQILAYLGIRPVLSNPWERQYEIIPLEELGRPRIDVTVNICGFFRDMFPNLIETLSDQLERIAALDEPSEKNYLKAHTLALKQMLTDGGYSEEDAQLLSVSRIFGPAAGQYGSGITKFFENHDWESEEQIGRSFAESLDHVYNRQMHGYPAQELYRENLRAVDIVSQLRSSNEYEITDLDHYFEFFGGLSKSVELAKGAKAVMYITDTAAEAIYTETVDKSIARGIRSRVLNPKWIDAMLQHDQHGAQQIADRFENVMGLAATTGSVDAWIYDELNAKYVQDESVRRRMEENNPFAYMKILEQLTEYSDRGYWNATPEQLEHIRNVYLELENNLEGTL